MRENFLHYIWKYKKFKILHLQTTCGKSVEIISVGTHNHNSGPDFLNAKIRIDKQLWVGNVEIHVRSSDWYKHGHDKDINFDSVILHVVYEDDSKVFRRNNYAIPALQLQEYISKNVFVNYEGLLSNNKSFVACERDFHVVDDFVRNTWLQRLFFERLEDKVYYIEEILKGSNNDWEATLFVVLAKSFGLKINSDAFITMAKSIPYSIVRKLQSKQTALEALFFGQSQLLEFHYNDHYFQKLKDQYLYSKLKYDLSNETVITPKFLRLRPYGFPTIRLSQLAMLYHKEERLCSKVISSNTVSEYYDLFEISASAYWDDHYTFQKESIRRSKLLSRAFVDIILINAVIPFKLLYAKHHNLVVSESIIALASNIDSEKNRIITNYESLGVDSSNALHSQGLLQLYTHYCKKLKCLECAIGNSLLSK